MRILDQMSVLVAAAYAGEGGGSLGVGVCGAAQGSRDEPLSELASMGIELSPNSSAKAIPYGTEAVDYNVNVT